MKRLGTGFCFLMMGLLGSAQQKDLSVYKREFSFTTENDAYLLQLKDAYYTNGAFLKFAWMDRAPASKIIHAAEMGQLIFTPSLRKSNTPETIDRPYAGYLYLKYSQTRFTARDQILQASLSLGLVGSASLGEQLQNTYHRWLRYSRFQGWQFQVRNSPGVDLGLSAATTLVENPQFFKLLPAVQASLGTNFTQARLGAYFVLGAFEKNQHSALWHARLSHAPQALRRKYEFFLYSYPQLVAQGYNATVQGGLFNKGNGAVLRDASPWIFQNNLGLCFAQDRWTTRVEHVYQTRETPAQPRSQQYASILVSYRMH